MEPHSDMAEDQLLSAEEPPQSSRPTRPLNALSKLVESDSESDNNEPQAQPSRGKLLARLQPQMNDETSESEEDDAVENGDAYERVKKMLMADTKKSDARKTPEPILQSTETISSEDEEDMPVRANNARRRPTRWEQDNSPRGSLVPSLISRESSPGLFVTPNASPAKRNVRGPAVGTTNSPSERHQDNQDLEERVRRIRAERLAKQKLQQKHKQPTKAARRDREASESDSDGENGRRLTQQSRPTRKAGKKALEDIAREQQRISRNMQLTHQAKTKKKYGVSDLFSRFGLAKVDSELVPAAAVALPDMSSAMASSDVEGAEQYDTPPSSPPKGDEEAHKGKTPDATTSTQQEERTTVDLAAAASNEPPRTLDKGKGRAPEFQHLPVNPLIEQTRPAQKVPAVNVSKPESADMVELSDSDDDLEIVQPGKPSIFDKIPERKQQQGGCSLLRLQYLANLNSPEKKGRKGQKGMSMAELRLSLAQKARQQAQRERDEKIEELRRRGIHIETVEERERHQLEIEDMVAQLEKSREEDFKLAKLEKAAAKKAGEILDDLPSSDESEDEDYTGSGDEAPVEEEEVGEEGELELSGSEEEMDEGDDADDEEMEEEQADNPLIDNVAEESEREQEAENVAQDHSKDVDDDEEEFQAPRPRPSTKRARKVIVEEDEESDQEPQRAPTQVTKNPSTPTRTTGFTSQSQDDDALAAFGGFDSAAKNLGLTQMFAGTMADYGSASQDAHPVDKEPEQDSLDYLRSLPDTQPSDLPTGLDPPDTLIPNSQTQMSPQKDMQFSLGISQLLESTPAFSPTQPAEEFEPTQDAGFQLPRSSAGLAPPTSTVETVMLSVAESPVMKKKSRLRRGKDAPQTVLPDMDGDFQADELASEAAEQTVDSGNAFSVMKKAAKKQKKVDNFNKKTSWARDAIHEQAEESEDEYAGIGGASDEDSDENDEELAEMIDTNEVKVDERRLAAYYAYVPLQRSSVIVHANLSTARRPKRTMRRTSTSSIKTS